MEFLVEAVGKSSEKEMVDFLKAHEDYCLFLLSNFHTYGATLTDSPYSGNFKVIRAKDEVVAVFCLTRKGSLLIESTLNDALFDTVLGACRQEPVPLKNVIGNWNFCGAFWEFLKSKKLINKEIFAEREILYRVDVKKVKFPSHPNVRLLIEQDYSQWQPLRLDFIKEEGFPNDLTEKQLREIFFGKTSQKIAWGYFLNNTLVSIADLNAKALDLGQVGGVYTAPQHRRKGYSKAVMMQLLNDVQALHSLRKLMIFTGEKNFAAQKMYLSLGASQVGYFSLLFGEPSLHKDVRK